MNSTSKRIVFIFVLAVLLRAAFLWGSPFYKDEALYAEMMEESVSGGGLALHYAGTAVAWKPPLMFWVYSVFALPFGGLVPPEMVYRFPSVLIGAACAVLTYLLVKEVSGNEDVGFITGIAYAGNGLGIIVGGMLMTDSLLSFFVLGALLCYVKAGKEKRLALLGGFFTTLAIFTKTMMGLIVPVLAIVYYLFSDRKKLLEPEFLASLLFAPLAFGLLYFMVPGILDQYYVDSTSRVNQTLEIGYAIGQNLTILGLTLPWLAIAIYGMLKFKAGIRHPWFWYAWLLIALVPLSVSGPLFWYFLPLVPVVSFFSAKVILGEGKADWLAVGFTVCLVLVSLPGAYAYYKGLWDFTLPWESKEIGSYLAGKDVLFVGFYNPTVLYYRFHEDRDYGSMDVMFVSNRTVLSDAELKALVSNSTLPQGSVRMPEALLGPFVLERIYLGNFKNEREYIALDREIYDERISGRNEYADVKVVKETELFVVIKKEG